MSDEPKIEIGVLPQFASQRFACAAENVDPTPWRYALLDRGMTVLSGQASFRATAWAKCWLRSIGYRRACRVERKTRELMAKHGVRDD
jgi:hypothetical protein